MAGHFKLLSPPLQGQDVDVETSSASYAPPATSPTASALNTIEQVRELLYGDAMRNQGRRVEDVQEAVHALEQRMLQRLEEMQGSVDALARALRQEQSASLRSIGGAIVEMGRQITSMGELRDRSSDVKSA